MHPVIVVTELGLLAPEERWEQLVSPLEAELEESGLGRVLDFEALRREANERGYCPAKEVAVELRDLGYGRDLVDAVVAGAGLAPGCRVMPLRWRGYHCEEYFDDGWAERGHFDDASQTPVVVPLPEAYEDVAHQFLVIGRPGSDGINFGYRHGHTGVWAYPFDGEFRFLVDTVAELVESWGSGTLSV